MLDEEGDWPDYLWTAEYVHKNNAKNVSTGYSPFYMNSGRHPNSQLDFDSVRVPAVQEQAQHIARIHQLATQNLVSAKDRYKHFADHKRKKQPDLQVGDRVWLCTKNLRLRGTRKFQPRFIGPYPIAKIINPVTYKLALPSTAKFHPVFHISLLKKIQPSLRQNTPPTPLVLDGEIEYEVKRILDSKRVHNDLFYLIDWRGYGPEERSWEHSSNVHSPRLIKAFHAKFPTKPWPEETPLGGGTVRSHRRFPPQSANVPLICPPPTLGPILSTHHAFSWRLCWQRWTSKMSANAPAESAV